MNTEYIIDRTKAVIESCNTLEQLESAVRYCKLMSKQLPTKTIVNSYIDIVALLVYEQWKYLNYTKEETE